MIKTYLICHSYVWWQDKDHTCESYLVYANSEEAIEKLKIQKGFTDKDFNSDDDKEEFKKNMFFSRTII